jgi:serine/threonine-protein kinase ATR
VIPLVASRICTHPSLLAEICRFLSISPTDFITVTLSRMLPQVFANCDSKALEKIAKELSKKPSTLFLNFSHHILAHVFLLPSQVQIDNAISFILKVLRDAADNAKIDIQSVVHSCLVPLLAELVVVMGDEDPEKAKKASTIVVSANVIY